MWNAAPKIKKKEYKFIGSSDEKINNIFEMKRTKQPDVYELYLEDKKINIAYVPSQQCSTMCKSFFENGCKAVNVICEYDVSKNKWKPKRLSSHKPDSLAKFEENFRLSEKDPDED